MRMIRLLATGGIALLVACTSSDAPTADVVVSPDQLMQELIADPGAAIDTYDGKLLEISGVVDSRIAPGGLNETRGIVFAGTSEQTRFNANLSFFGFDPEKADDFDAITVGQQVTLVCRFTTLDRERMVFLVKSCQLA
jgi:hypothetical protein